MVIDAGQGRAGMIPTTHNLAAFPDGIGGRDLLDRMRAHARRYGAVIDSGRVVSVNGRDHLFHVSTETQVEIAQTVIFATGVFNHRPPLSVADHDRALAGGLIRYCPVCDAYEVRKKRIAVLGDGSHALQEAKFLTPYSHSVTLIPTDGSVGIEQDGVRSLGAPMQGLAVTDTQVIVTLHSGATAFFDTLYVAMGTSACSTLAAELGLRRDESGHVDVDSDQRTSMDRVFAIGDLTQGLDQIAVAMGQGAVAATAIHNDLPAKSDASDRRSPAGNAMRTGSGPPARV